MYSSPHTPIDKAAEPLTAPPPKLMVYAHRIRVARSLKALTNRLIVASVAFILLAYILNSFIRSNSSNSPVTYFSLTLFVVAYIVLLGKMVLNRWIAERSLLANAEPVLMITDEGIAMRGSLSFNTIFLPWSEIESVDVYTFRYRYLCVRPRNMTLFMQRLSLPERNFKLSDSLYGMPPLTIALSYLDRPVEEILQQLYHMYAKELSYYHVQVRS